MCAPTDEKQNYTMEIIARVRSDFPSKFGIPRQSGLAGTFSTVVFEPQYRNEDALRGIGSYSRIWLIWGFSANACKAWSPTVRPPKLGGNLRMGVFATRSPFRPNPIGLSTVGLERVELRTPDGPILHIVGADLMDGTPVFDIKPYIPYTDAYPEASSGFAIYEVGLKVECPPRLLARLPQKHRTPLIEILKQDPRPGYHHETDRVYGFEYAGFEIKFTVEDKTLTLTDVSPIK